MISLRTLFKKAKEQIRADEDFIVLSILGGILAGFAIGLNNQILLIASMLIAPFFDSIISLAVFIVKLEWREFIKALYNYCLITIFSLASASVIFFILSFSRELAVVEYTAALDIEYFLVAIALGVLGALLWIWPKIPNIGAGLAVAISLVPPVANISRGVVLFDNSIVTESLLTFLMNTAGVIIGALFIFFYKYKLRH